MTELGRLVGAMVAMGTIVLGSANAYGQSIVQVPEGETFTVTEERMFVDEWVMEDNSRVLFDPSIKTWTINARRARFGDNTTIIGVGSDGSNGQSSHAHGSDAGRCDDGGRGGEGYPGNNGTAGVTIHITMGLVSVTNLVIDVHGGSGGDGGDGANGGRGGRASCTNICAGQEGGNGGNGGRAGHGGNAGNVKISYWLAGQEPLSFGSSNGLRVYAAGGDPGRPGRGGLGGIGGPGKSCLGGVYKRGEGRSGSNGQAGKVGQPGQEGTVDYVVLPSPQ